MFSLIILVVLPSWCIVITPESENLITRQGWGPNWWQMAILTAPGVHPSLAMGLERKTVIMLSSVIATDHTLLYLDIRKIHRSSIDTQPLYCRKRTTHCREPCLIKQQIYLNFEERNKSYCWSSGDYGKREDELRTNSYFHDAALRYVDSTL